MDFRQLQSYISIVKYKNFTIAAEKLGIAQPTLSIHLKSLEEELNTKLILRSPKIFKITSRGQEFFEFAQNVMKLRNDMLNRWNGQESRVIHMGVSTIPSAYILPEILPEFGKSHESVYFSVEQGDSQEIIEAVDKGKYEIGLVGMETKSEYLVFEKFYQDKMVLITPVSEKYLSWKDDTVLSVERLKDEPMIIREKGSGSGKSASQFLAQIGLQEEKLHIVARMNDQESIKNLVEGGLGVSIVSQKAVKDCVASKRILEFELPEKFSGRSFYLVYQKDYILNDSVKEFMNFIKKYYSREENTL